MAATQRALPLLEVIVAWPGRCLSHLSFFGADGLLAYRSMVPARRVVAEPIAVWADEIARTGGAISASGESRNDEGR